MTAWELVRLGSDLSVIHKGGGGNYKVYGQNIKGLEAVTDYIDSNPDIAKRLWEDIKNMQLIGRAPITDVNDLSEEELGEGVDVE